MKSFGYLISILSVALLAIPAWDNAVRKPPLLAALIAGVLLSMLGMALRWASYRRERGSDDPA